MSADQEQFYARLADSVRQSPRVDLTQAVEALYHRVGQELRPGYEQVADLTQQLAALQAKIDSLERLQRQTEEEKLMQQASNATQETETFMAEMEQQPRSAADAEPSPYVPDRSLDIKFVTSLVSSYVPVFKAAGSVQVAKYSLNSARYASDTLSVANQQASDALFASKPTAGREPAVVSLYVSRRCA